MVMRCVMRHAWTPKFQLSETTVHSLYCGITTGNNQQGGGKQPSEQRTLRSAQKSLPNLAYSFKEKLGEMAHPPRRPQPDRNSTVLPLYGLPENAGNGTNVHTTLQRQQSEPVNVLKIKSLLENVKNTPEDNNQFRPCNYERSLSHNNYSTWVRVGGHIQGSNFNLRVNSNQQNTQSFSQSARVREVDSTPYKKESDSNFFQEISDFNPMFEVEIERSMETTCNGTGNSNTLNVQLTLSTEVGQNMNYLILQKDAGSTRWQDITETHTTIQDSRRIEIPVKKSSKIWVIRLKKSFGSLKHALLALIHGKILFHILVYYMKKPGKVKVRIIGINEELYQNPKHLKTAVTIAEEDKFQKCPEVPPKMLVKKGYLNVVVRKNGEHVDSRQFDIGGSNNRPDWFDCSFTTNELEENLEVKVTDRDGNVQWSLDLNEALCDDNKPVKQPGCEDISKPEITMSFDDEVCEDHIPWLALHLNKDVETVARLLRVDSDAIDAMKEAERAETRNIKILDFWRKTTLGSGNKPIWNQIKTVLECERVGRFDIIRCLQNEEEIDKEVFLWLEQRVASFCCQYARVLGVPDHEVSMINDSGDNCCEQRCTLLLKRWRQRTPNPKLEDLIEALEHDTMKKNELAKEMRKKFGKEG